MSTSESEAEEFFDVAASRETQLADVAAAMSESLRSGGFGLAQRQSPVTADASLDTGLTGSTPTTSPLYTATKTSRSQSRDRSESPRLQGRYSLPPDAIPVPAIPARFLISGYQASSVTPAPPGSTSSERIRTGRNRNAEIIPASALRTLSQSRPRTSASDTTSHCEGRALSVKPTASRSSPYRDDGVITGHHQLYDRTNNTKRTSPTTISARRKSLSALPSTAVTTPSRVIEEALAKLEKSSPDEREVSMARRVNRREDDLFLELAHDAQAEDERPVSRDRTASRVSQATKRRSLPMNSRMTSAEGRPRSSGIVLGERPGSKALQSSALSAHPDRFRDTPRDSQADDTISMSGRSAASRSHRYTVGAPPERSPMSAGLAGRIRSSEIRSSEQPSYARRNQLFGRAQDSQDESPAESSEPKRSQDDSGSADSDTADTVWDELDDLKSRIKRLELTGKMPSSSSAAISGSSSERPRTATTAPTTIGSSPQQERKQSQPESEAGEEDTAGMKTAPQSRPQSRHQPQSPTTGHTVGGPSAAGLHPLLHSGLAKAKSLLNGTLYRALEASAADALQLAAMAGSAGPQGTTFTAASAITGMTVSDRAVRRKADSMCRNLTDLCLALCEGKHEALNVTSVTASPVTVEVPKASPIIRYSRSSIGPDEDISKSSKRPMSRLEARRSSILGIQRSTSISSSRRESNTDLSASEYEGTPSHSQALPRELRRVARASSRLLSVRAPVFDDVSGDDDPTVRPVSRAMTDVGKLRAGSAVQSQPLSPQSPQTPQSGSLREAIAARRANSGAYDQNREGKRVASMSSEAARRRWNRESTPAVREEEEDYEGKAQGPDIKPLSSPRRRITSLGPYSARRSGGDLPSRTTSLGTRRHVAVE
ncbi:LPXTG-motif cell wall anchor domain protein [Teratosphaeria destructans]|uniref:LPXTG-motif cell wall anchor domain protein n=1 Tax=Teratosphaeria destructans TaxID=418781 RepID=A0A9W7T140_9PEZI|nr:LPXTG-motif cell wall anchor domain protein [Teratosphaeria destructans]